MASRFSGDMAIPEVIQNLLSPLHIAKETIYVEGNPANVMMACEKGDAVCIGERKKSSSTQRSVMG